MKKLTILSITLLALYGCGGSDSAGSSPSNPIQPVDDFYPTSSEELAVYIDSVVNNENFESLNNYKEIFKTGNIEDTSEAANEVLDYAETNPQIKEYLLSIFLDALLPLPATQSNEVTMYSYMEYLANGNRPVQPPKTCDQLGNCESFPTPKPIYEFEDKDSCEEHSGYWYFDTCHSSPLQPLPEIKPIDLFDNELECVDNGGYWYDNSCHESEQTVSYVFVSALPASIRHTPKPIITDLDTSYEVNEAIPGTVIYGGKADQFDWMVPETNETVCLNIDDGSIDIGCQNTVTASDITFNPDLIMFESGYSGDGCFSVETTNTYNSTIGSIYACDGNVNLTDLLAGIPSGYAYTIKASKDSSFNNKVYTYRGVTSLPVRETDNIEIRIRSHMSFSDFFGDATVNAKVYAFETGEFEEPIYECSGDECDVFVDPINPQDNIMWKVGSQEEFDNGGTNTDYLKWNNTTNDYYVPSYNISSEPFDIDNASWLQYREWTATKFWIDYRNDSTGSRSVSNQYERLNGAELFILRSNTVNQINISWANILYSSGYIDASLTIMYINDGFRTEEVTCKGTSMISCSNGSSLSADDFNHWHPKSRDGYLQDNATHLYNLIK